MARKAGSVAVSIIKWVAVPIVLAGIGFYVVGPRVQEAYLARVQPNKSMPFEEPDPADTPKAVGEPKVEVSAQKINNSQPRRRRSRSSEPRREPTEDTAPPIEEPSPEPPSSPDIENNDGAGDGA